MRREVLDEVCAKKIRYVVNLVKMSHHVTKIGRGETAVPQFSLLEEVPFAGVDDFVEEGDDDALDVSGFTVVGDEKGERANLAHRRAHRFRKLLERGRM